MPNVFFKTSPSRLFLLLIQAINLLVQGLVLSFTLFERASGAGVAGLPPLPPLPPPGLPPPPEVAVPEEVGVGAGGSGVGGEGEH